MVNDLGGSVDGWDFKRYYSMNDHGFFYLCKKDFYCVIKETGSEDSFLLERRNVL